MRYRACMSAYRIIIDDGAIASLGSSNTITLEGALGEAIRSALRIAQEETSGIHIDRQYHCTAVDAISGERLVGRLRVMAAPSDGTGDA